MRNDISFPASSYTTDKQSPQTELLPPSDSVLKQLGIEPSNIKSITPRWKRTQYRAIINWLSKYKPSPEDSNLEKVKGLLEAFYHLCEVEDWQTAVNVFQFRLNTPTKEELHNQLGIWGYYLTQIELYKKLFINEVTQNAKSNFLIGLGNAYADLGDYDLALEYHSQSLKIAHKIPDRSIEGRALGSLGLIYCQLGDYSKAIEYQLQSLEIKRQIKDLEGEGNSLTNLLIIIKSI